MIDSNTLLVERFLDAVRARQKRRDISIAFIYLITFVSLLLFGGVLGDHLLGLPKFLRFMFLGTLILTFTGSLFFGIIRPLIRKISQKYAAKVTEDFSSELQGNLLAFSELSDKSSPVANALAEKSLRKIEKIVLSDIIPGRKLAKSFLLLIGIVSLFFAYGFLSPKSTLDSIVRLLNPNTAIAAPTATKIDSVSPGSAVILEGSQVVFSVSISALMSLKG